MSRQQRVYEYRRSDAIRCGLVGTTEPESGSASQALATGPAPAVLSIADVRRVWPALQDYERDARSIALRAKWDWFPLWIGNFDQLRYAVRELCAANGMDYRDVHHAVVEHLLTVYRDASILRASQAAAVASPRGYLPARR